MGGLTSLFKGGLSISKEEHLTGKEIILQSYDKLAERNPHSTVTLQKKPIWVATDSPGDKFRYMKYEELKLFEFESGRWFVGKGEYHGPIGYFDWDIAAFRFSGGKENYFIKSNMRSSLIYFMDTFSEKKPLRMGANVFLRIHGAEHEEEMLAALRESVPGFECLVRSCYGQTRLLDMGEMQVREGLYKPELVDTLTLAIEKVLGGKED